MRARTARLSVAVAGLAAVSLSATSFAAAKPAPTAKPKSLVVTDPAGDVKYGKGDITALAYTTSGTVVKKKYIAKNLVITLTAADAIDTSGTTVYEINTVLDGCSYFDLVTQPGSMVGDYVACGDPDPTSLKSTDLSITAAVSGNKIVWTIPFTELPNLKVGAEISSLEADTGTAEPVQGIGPYLLAGFGAPTTNDKLTSDASYKIG